MRRVLRSNKRQTRWSCSTPGCIPELPVQGRRGSTPLLCYGEREVQEFMDTKIEKQMIRARNIIKVYLAFMIFIWILWILTMFPRWNFMKSRPMFKLLTKSLKETLWSNGGRKCLSQSESVIKARLWKLLVSWFMSSSFYKYHGQFYSNS